MNLKEAFRYQNRLQSDIDEAKLILSGEKNVTKVEKTHLRHKVNPEASDETVQETADNEFSDRITDLARFLVFLLAEKEKLSRAIRKAKEALPIDMDSETSLNSVRQSIARTFMLMNGIRSSEQILSNGGFGLKFNGEGEQVTYRCDLKQVTTINFDRNVIKALMKELNRKADEASAQLDLCLVNSGVEYEPPFDVNSSFSDAFGEFSPSGG